MARRLVFRWCFLPATALLSQAPVFKVDVNLVSVSVHVTDRRGRDVSGLTQSSFSLLEDGVAQRIAFFGAEEQPASLAILLDTSSSMQAAGKMEHAKAALSELIAAGHPENQIFYMEFGSELSRVVEIAGSRQGLPAISRAAAGHSGTALYDAIAVALCRLRQARYLRQALIVVTDGADQHSRLKLDELIRTIQGSRAQVYMVGEFSAEEREIFGAHTDTVTLVSGRQIDNPVLAFEHLARESGAECFFPSTAGALRRAVEAVARELETQYTLGYYPVSSEKPYRHIQVKVLRRGLKVRTRRGVGTMDAGVHFTIDTCEISAQDHPYPYESKLTREEGRPVYREDFADPRSGWPLSESSWYGSGEYHLARRGRLEPVAEGTVSAYGPWWDDVRASISAKLVAANPGGERVITTPAAGLVFRLNDLGYYALLISTRPALYAELIAKPFRAPKAIELMPWVRIGDANQSIAARWVTLAAECRGDEIVVYVDNREIGRVQDTRFQDGYVGMCLFGPGHAVFRDLVASP